MRMRTRLSIALGLFLVAGLGAGPLAAQDSKHSEAPIPDTEVGLAKGSVFEVLEPPVPEVNIADPGNNPLSGRAFATAPPRVPHAVADFMPITREDNLCVGCHVLDWAARSKDDPTAIPISHYMNLRGDTDDVSETIVGARWVCVSCHVPVTDAPALVENVFGD